MEGGSGGAKVRVVRCPSCDKLLPEPADFTVYRCGGCDATLQAKRPIPVSESDAENRSGVVSDGSLETNEPESKGIEPTSEERLLPDCHAGSVCRIEDGSGAEEGDGGYRRPSKAPIGDPNTKLEESRETKEQVEYIANVYRELQHKQAWRRDPYPDEGPSSYRLSPVYEYGDRDPAGKQNTDGPSRVVHLEQDRAELLRKLDELRDHLARSCEDTDRPKERAPVNRAPASSTSYGDRSRGGWYPEGSSSLNQAPGRHARFTDGGEMGRPSFNPTLLHASNGIPGHREPFGPPHTLGRAPFHHPPAPYLQRQLNNCVYEQFDPDPVISYHHDGFYRHDGFYHQPACSCLHCYNSHWLPPAQAPPSIFRSTQRVPYLLNNHGFNPVNGPSVLGQQSFNQRVPSASLHPQEPRIQQRAVFTEKDGFSCRPVAGAAPFIVCHSCLNLLRIPDDIFLMEKNRRKLRCGSCSHIISLKVDGRRLTNSAPTPNSQRVSENNIDSNGGMEEDLQYNDHDNGRPVLSYPEDYDSPGYDVPSTDEKLVLPSPSPISSQEMIDKEYGINLSESEKMQGLSFSSSTSENLESPDSMICQRDLPSSEELPLEAEATSQVSSFPLRKHFGYQPSNQMISRSGKGNMSKRTEQEKIVSLDANFKQNSVKDVPVAIEMDFSPDEYPNPGLSQDSCEADKDEDEPRIIRGAESFFAGLIKKSFKDFARFNQSMESGRSKVSVNGHPISERVAKKAEKLAGPIHPGEYWYDYRAGFWGVMGHRCLGIIPPFIEEFNYPLLENCAGGNTDVLVNGRELHKKDLDLLVARGLPATEGQSYIIEISGKVWDEASGEELDSLGKLAPTVEKVKHGFGMRVPSVRP